MVIRHAQSVSQRLARRGEILWRHLQQGVSPGKANLQGFFPDNTR
jgi:hypothetical protein